MWYVMVAVIACLCWTALVAASETKGFALSSDSVRLYYEKRGSGRPLLIIAGGPGDAHTYLRPSLRQLENELSVIYFDGRGRGRSTRLTDGSRYTLANDVDDVEALRKHLGLSSLAVFGHSYGGVVAGAYAAAYPERVQALILCNAFHSAEGWQENIDNCNEHIRQSYPEVWKKLEEIGLKGHSNTNDWRTLYDPCIGSLYWYHPGQRKKYLKEIAALETAEDAFSLDVYYAMIGPDPDVEVGGTMKDFDLRERLSGITAPTLVIGGREDRISTIRQAVEIQRCVPHSKLRIFEHSGHYPFFEQRKKFHKLVLGFLNKTGKE